MIGKIIDRLSRSPAKYFSTEAAMRRHGMRRLMKWAHMYNTPRNGARAKQHQRVFDSEKDLLLAENADGKFSGPPLKMVDGWALDTSRTLPHLEALLAQCGEVVAERGGRRHSEIQRPFLRSLHFPGDENQYPAFLDFILSSEVLSVTMDYLRTIPVLSKINPPGFRLMESNSKLDPDAVGPPRDSQLYHVDYYVSPMVYVLVAIEDVTLESGPWTFLPASISARIGKQLGYGEKGSGHRIPDEDIRPLIRADEEIVFALPKGSVLFIDSSKCLHFGSRDSQIPRFMMMYGLTPACRQDFVLVYANPLIYPLRPTDSRLRRMVLS